MQKKNGFPVILSRFPIKNIHAVNYNALVRCVHVRSLYVRSSDPVVARALPSLLKHKERRPPHVKRFSDWFKQLEHFLMLGLSLGIYL